MAVIQLLFTLLLITTGIEEISKEAIIAIQEAEEDGADVSTLIDRFNYLQTVDDCDEGCINEYNSIIKEAKALKSFVSSKAIMDYIFIFGIYMPIIAFSLSSLIIYMYDLLKRFKLKRFMMMEIEYRDDKNA